MNLTNRYAVIVAGGSGSRMASEIPKQFLLLNGLPVLMHTITKFSQCGCEAIIVVLPPSQIKYWQELCDQFRFSISHEVVEGGNTRFDSVKNGLLSIKVREGLVAIHDGVRPCINQLIIEEGYQHAQQAGCAIAAVRPKDSLRLQQQDGSTVSVDRGKYYCVQTPQVFYTNHIIKVYEQATTNHFTDDAAVYESAGFKVSLYEGDYRNIKITTPEDLILAGILLDY